MYILSTHLKPVQDAELKACEQSTRVKLPESYRRFLSECGQGTYRGLINISLPDAEVLQEFAEYDLWEHGEESPVSREQIAECVVSATTIDGDFVALHPAVEGLLWLPRHSEEITWSGITGPDFTAILDRLISDHYGNEYPGISYFDPWNNRKQHLFLHLKDGSLTLEELALLCRERFGADLWLETPHSGQLFLQDIGGGIRFNYAYRLEVAVFFEPGEFLSGAIIRFLEALGCVRQNS
ncbi:hypothetical protein GCM10010912_37500 [Paenibacillus albidus]|uniref:Knr4/Smi1-like domain-containing protein n=1 Tax=Paenibacillus albidus TaxID=2041023 RepID=A0A917CHP3_9BACL|nr:SMI1/KNR4 family protein [Paenibacillus albidus]GGF88806.1 hypothetical protein GCM10010912_37500 [Paenibacillus albidus]